jgi:hypothetical protein
MGKKEKKSKKKSKRHLGDAANKSCSKAQQQRSSDSIHSKSIPINVRINIQTTKCSSGSWGAAFAAASAIRPNEADLDGDFLQRTENAGDSKDDKGVGGIAQLARRYKPSKSVTDQHNFRGAVDDNASADSTDVPLEGRMMSLSTDSNKQTMVLVDKQCGKVYSSSARLENGCRLVIGTIAKGNIHLDKEAIKEMHRIECEKDTNQSSGPSFPYPTNPDDHCETPIESYRDILPILDELSKSKGGKRAKLRIYDPYYCNGSMVNHLEALGFTDVYNRKEDCYGVWESKGEPTFDVLLTNPPYSEDHIEKLMKYLTSPSFGSKPFLLLMPQWVHKKDYYINATTGGGKANDKKRKRGKCNDSNSSKCSPFYIVPKKRYVYLPPPDFREKKVSDVHKKSSPFTSMWFVWGGTFEMNDVLMGAFRKSNTNGCELARSRSALRDLRRAGSSKKSKEF